jgi:cupin fold WbuC family metalloprotein
MTIDKKFISQLFDKALLNPRLRINYDLRNSEDDGSQRMLNAMLPGTQFSIHRHPNSSESVVIICGSIVEVFYDDAGNEIERTPLCPEYGYFGCQIPKGTWHSIEVYAPSVIIEAKEGKYGDDESEILNVEQTHEHTAKKEFHNSFGDLKKNIEYLIGEERSSGNIETPTAAYISEVLNAPLSDVEATMKDMDL